MQSNQRKCSKAAIVLMVGLFTSAAASAGGLMYQPQFPDQPAAYVPPAVLVGFNPQPEPPARMVIAGDLSARDPGVLITGIEGENIDLLLGIGGGHQRLARMFLVGDSCGIEANIRLYPLFRQVQIPAECRGAFRIGARFTDGSRLNLDVTVHALRGDTLVPPGTLVGFNPQPEPPAIPSFGLRVDLRGTAADGVSVDVALSDRRGNAIPLR